MIANSTALVLTRQSGLFSCQKYDSIIYLAGFGGDDLPARSGSNTTFYSPGLAAARSGAWSNSTR